MLDGIFSAIASIVDSAEGIAGGNAEATLQEQARAEAVKAKVKLGLVIVGVLGALAVVYLVIKAKK